MKGFKLLIIAFVILFISSQVNAASHKSVEQEKTAYKLLP